MSACRQIVQSQSRPQALILGPSPLRALATADVSVTRDLFGAKARAEVLNLTRPNLVQKAHKLALDAGADVIRTFTDAATPHQFDRYRMYDEAFIVNYMASELAVSTAAAAHGSRKVMGWVRVDGRVPGLGFPCLAEGEDAVRIMVSAQVAAGVDFICLDLPHPIDRITAALNGVRQGFAEAGRAVPIYARLSFDPAFSIGSVDHMDALGEACSVLRTVSIAALNVTGPISTADLGWTGAVWADRVPSDAESAPVMVGAPADGKEISRARKSLQVPRRPAVANPILANSA